jgi:hypothetical protein
MDFPVMFSAESVAAWMSKMMFLYKGRSSKNKNPMYQLPDNWYQIPDANLPPELKGKNVSFAVTLIIK